MQCAADRLSSANGAYAEAERQLEELAGQHEREAAALREEEEALARRRREMDRRHEGERVAAEAAVERQRSVYSEALTTC